MRTKLLILAGLLGTLGAIAGGTYAAVQATGQPKAPAVPAPVIQSGPASKTTKTTATFTFTHSQANVTFQCGLDGAAFSACSSPKTYPGPIPAGGHDFRVRAVASNGSTSSEAKYSWEVVKPPAPVITSGPNTPTTKLSATFAFTDSDTDPGVSFQCRLDDGAWGACSSPKQYPGPLKLGGHKFQVQLLNAAGDPSDKTSYSWEVVKPPAPVITSGPDDPTTELSASFTFTDSDTDPGVSFQCRLDDSAWAACSSPKQYAGPLKQGDHTFQVRLLNAAGDPSDKTSYGWTIQKSISFPIAGNLGVPLYPGRTAPLLLTITNPFNFPISVSGLAVSVRAATTKAGCNGSQNISVQQYSGQPVTVPALSSVTLQASQAPRITMLDLPTNQDACKGATFTFDYNGTATKARR